MDRTATQVVALGTRQVGEVACLIQNPDRDLLPGTNVNVEIRAQAVENALTVRSDLHRAVLAGFRAGNVKIPFPPHDARVPGAGMFEPHPADPAAEQSSG